MNGTNSKKFSSLFEFMNSAEDKLKSFNDMKS
jgi:hypothetical protein